MFFFADSGDEMEVPDITPRTKKGKRKSSEDLDFSGSLGLFNLFLIHNVIIFSLPSLILKKSEVF